MCFLEATKKTSHNRCHTALGVILFNSADMSKFADAGAVSYLPSPPFGHFWFCNGREWVPRAFVVPKNKQWSCCLDSAEKNGYCAPECICNEDGIGEHVVMKGDGLENISERYNCSIAYLLLCNHISDGPLPKYIRIPVQKGSSLSRYQTFDRPSILQRFINETSYSDEEAHDYLLNMNYNFVDAMNQLDETGEWMKKYKDSLLLHFPAYKQIDSSKNLDIDSGGIVNTPLWASPSSLPPPPDGMTWHQLEGGNWDLCTDTAQDIANHDNSMLGFHRVEPTDTLQGLCLKYGTNVLHLRRLNHLIGNDIKHLKFVRISCEETSGLSLSHQQEGTVGDVALADLLSKKCGITHEEAQLYLQIHNGDFDAALGECSEDTEWERAANVHKRNT